MSVKISRNRPRETERSQSGSIAQDRAIGRFVRRALGHPLDSIEATVKGTNYPVTGRRVFVNNYYPSRQITAVSEGAASEVSRPCLNLQAGLGEVE